MDDPFANPFNPSPLDDVRLGSINSDMVHVTYNVQCDVCDAIYCIRCRGNKGCPNKLTCLSMHYIDPRPRTKFHKKGNTKNLRM